MLPTLPDKSVHCVVTSPPYFGLRLYLPDVVQIDPALSDQARADLLAELAKLGVDHIR